MPLNNAGGIEGESTAGEDPCALHPNTKEG